MSPSGSEKKTKPSDQENEAKSESFPTSGHTDKEARGMPPRRGRTFGAAGVEKKG